MILIFGERMEPSVLLEYCIAALNFLKSLAKNGDKLAEFEAFASAHYDIVACDCHCDCSYGYPCGHAANYTEAVDAPSTLFQVMDISKNTIPCQLISGCDCGNKDCRCPNVFIEGKWYRTCRNSIMEVSYHRDNCPMLDFKLPSSIVMEDCTYMLDLINSGTLTAMVNNWHKIATLQDSTAKDYEPAIIYVKVAASICADYMIRKEDSVDVAKSIIVKSIYSRYVSPMHHLAELEKHNYQLSNQIQFKLGLSIED